MRPNVKIVMEKRKTEATELSTNACDNVESGTVKIQVAEESQVEANFLQIKLKELSEQNQFLRLENEKLKRDKDVEPAKGINSRLQECFKKANQVKYQINFVEAHRATKFRTKRREPTQF